MPMPGGEEGACPKARPAQASVTPKAVFQFAENMAPTPLRDSVPKTPLCMASYPFLSVPPNLRISRTLSWTFFKNIDFHRPDDWPKIVGLEQIASDADALRNEE